MCHIDRGPGPPGSLAASKLEPGPPPKTQRSPTFNVHASSALPLEMPGPIFAVAPPCYAGHLSLAPIPRYLGPWRPPLSLQGCGLRVLRVVGSVIHSVGMGGWLDGR